MTNKIVVLLPVYNDPDGVVAALTPLRNANAQFDVVIVDDGSKPQLDVDPADYEFPIVCLRLERNSGIVSALNKGLRYVLMRKYEYLARIDAWDASAPDRLSKQAEFLDENPNCGIVGCEVDFVDWVGTSLYHYGPKLNHRDIIREMRYRPSFVHPAVMIRSSVMRKTGPYADHFPGGEDYELFHRILEVSEGHNLPEPLLRVYLNPRGISISRRRQLIRSRLRLQIARFDAYNLHSYLGVMRTLMLFAMPYQLLYALKRLLRPATEENTVRHG